MGSKFNHLSLPYKSFYLVSALLFLMLPKKNFDFSVLSGRQPLRLLHRRYKPIYGLSHLKKLSTVLCSDLRPIWRCQVSLKFYLNVRKKEERMKSGDRYIQDRYLLHNLVLLEHGLVFEDLCLDLMLDEFLVLRTLNLTTGLAELAVVVDLVGQVHS